jgi:PAS domain S-box-containing protein
MTGAGGRALAELARALAEARDEGELAAAVAAALAGLRPGSLPCVRLLDPRTLATERLEAPAPPRPGARDRLALRREAVRAAGLSEAAAEAGGVALVEHDAPVLEGAATAVHVPVAAGGALLGAVGLERPPAGEPGAAVGAAGVAADAAADEEALLPVAGLAALALRSLRAREEAAFLKTYLEELLENANAPILVTNRQREVLIFNRAVSRLTGLGREEALGADLLRLLPDRERERARRALERSLAGEAVTGLETRLRLRAGGEAQVLFHTAPVAGPGGEVEGVIAIGQDLTALRAMEERAEHYERLAGFGRLAAGIVHELNNPLVAIVSYTDSLLQRHRLGGMEAGDLEKLRRIREAGERIQRFSRDLIAYARPSTDPPERVDVGALLEQAVRMCEPVLKEARAVVEPSFTRAPRVLGVRSSLVQVFVNLVTNAAQALGPGGGHVRLGVTASGDRVVATVADDGAGMTDEVRARIFEPFFTTKQGGRGAGLGLSIVQGIVARHGGAVDVRSAPGEGTTVTVSLPVEGPDRQGTSESTA